ncbi:MAG TPA: alpha/beta hydrolase [Actinomycetota bacterium]|nr:alpha/beta hydrolase [Actinomycetota bacterium]
MVRGLVLIGPFVRNVPVGALKLALFRLMLLRPWGPTLWEAYVKRLHPSRPPADLAVHRARFREGLRRPDRWQAFLATTRTSHAPAEARLDRVRVPMLVVMGDRDPDFPDPRAEARNIAEPVGGEVLIVPGGGHYPQAEYPEVVGHAVVRFLGQVS